MRIPRTVARAPLDARGTCRMTELLYALLAESAPDREATPHEDVRNARAAERARVGTADARAAGEFPRPGAQPCAQAPLDPTDAAARRRRLLACPSAAGRPADACACAPQRHARGLELAAQISAREGPAGQLPRAARALPREGFFTRPRILLRLRAAGLSAPRGRSTRGTRA